MTEEIQVFYGSEVKDLGEGKVGGFLVLFGDKENPDATPLKDFFTKDTDFDLEPKDKSTIYYSHGLDKTIKNRKLGKGLMEVKDAGIWIEGQLELRDEYEKAIYGMVKDGKLGWSSGVPAHLVRRQKEGTSNKVLAWPLGKDASLTPNPAEPRTAALALKSLELKEVDWEKVLESLSTNKDSNSVKKTDETTETDTQDETITVSVKMSSLDAKTLNCLILSEIKTLKELIEKSLEKSEEVVTPDQTDVVPDNDSQPKDKPDQVEDDLLNALYVDPKVTPEVVNDILDDLTI